MIEQIQLCLHLNYVLRARDKMKIRLTADFMLNRSHAQHADHRFTSLILTTESMVLQRLKLVFLLCAGVR